MNLPQLKELRLHSQDPGMTTIYYNAFRDINANLYELYVPLLAVAHIYISYHL